MVLACQNISKAFGTDEILKNVSFHIEDNEKVAIVGINGAGKSTLLKIIMKELSADTGEVTISKDKTLGYLAQYQEITGDCSIKEEVLKAKESVIAMEAQIREMEAKMQHLSGEALNEHMEKYHTLCEQFEAVGGYYYQSEVTGVLQGLGFPPETTDKKLSELSGGQRTRVSLAKLLVTKPDVLLLDEPTNHLDISSIQWLENYLKGYKGAVILVSHDRYFLDRIVTKVVEVFMHEAHVYAGNYSDFAVKKAAIRAAKMKEYLNQQREIKHQEEVIAKLKQFNREKSIKRAESREKALDKIERVEKPMEENTDIHLHLTPNIISGKDVMDVRGLAKAYPNQPLFSDLNFSIKRGERVALIGDNGTGKTTILKIINQMVEADAGEVELGTNVHIGYYDQEHQLLNPENTLFEEIQGAYKGLNNTQVRNVLAAFLFTEDDVFKRIKEISGGERGRVSLAKLMLSEANFLILDEPTNHLDITSKEILEQALNQYEGTVFFVSHDRYFVNKAATRILDLTGQTLVNYIGNYDYYLEKQEELTRIYVQTNAQQNKSQESEDSGKQDWKQQKEKQAILRKKANELKKVEETIGSLESEKEGYLEESANPIHASNSGYQMELHEKISAIDEQLENLYEQWELLAAEMEDE